MFDLLCPAATEPPLGRNKMALRIPPTTRAAPFFFRPDPAAPGVTFALNYPLHPQFRIIAPRRQHPAGEGPMLPGRRSIIGPTGCAMAKRTTSRLRRSLTNAVAAALIIILVSSWGYWILDGAKHPFLDCLYMSVITITTIGYGEIIGSQGQPGLRLFTIMVALAGVGTMTYVLSSITAFIVEGELRDSFRKRKMEKIARSLEDHYIVCGAGKVGFHVIRELHATRRPCVVLERDPSMLKDLAASIEGAVYLQDDPTDDDALISAGIKKARGLFAATRDDNTNLVIVLTARQLSSRIHIVARCNDLKRTDKMKAAGADSVISPALIGGLRMASEMVRPTVVSFLDLMLRDTDKNLRLEEVSTSMAGKRITDLDLQRFRDTLLLAVRTPSGWVYNPHPDHVLDQDSHLVVMTTPEERAKLQDHFGKK